MTRSRNMDVEFESLAQRTCLLAFDRIQSQRALGLSRFRIRETNTTLAGRPKTTWARSFGPRWRRSRPAPPRYFCAVDAAVTGLTARVVRFGGGTSHCEEHHGG